MSLFRTIPTPGDFSPLFRLLDDYDVHCSSRGRTTTVRSFAPPFDVRETAEAYHLDGEVPGTAQEDIDIEFTDPQTLVIKGRTERETRSGSNTSEPQAPATEGESSDNEEAVAKVAEKTPKPHYWTRERTVGEFQRIFSFPTRVDQDNVQANLKNGILSVVVPKAAAPVAKKISVQ